MVARNLPLPCTRVYQSYSGVAISQSTGDLTSGANLLDVIPTRLLVAIGLFKTHGVEGIQSDGPLRLAVGIVFHARSSPGHWMIQHRFEERQ